MKPSTTLYDIAHARTGDKGNRSSICVVAYQAEHFELMVEQVTTEAVAKVFADRRPTRVQRFVLPKLKALNFVIDDVLDGGVNESLNLDTHGKTLSFRLLSLPIQLS